MTPKNFRQSPKPGWIVIGFLVVLVMLFATFRAGRDVVKLWRVSRMAHREALILDDATEKRDALRIEVERLLGDMDYIEEIARREYGMKRDGEEVFLLTPPDSINRRK